MQSAPETVQMKDVPDFPGYRCGDDGEAWSWKRNGGWRRLKPRTNKRGQLRVVLRRQKRSHDFLLGRLILMTFVGPCPEGMECLHWDDDPSNNRLSNLRWGTHKENGSDALRNRRYTQVGANHYMTRLDEGDVIEIRRQRRAGATATALAREYGLAHQQISKICRGKSWKTVPMTSKD